MTKEQVEQAYNKIDNLCCMNSNNQGFFDAYKETKDNDFCKDTYDMVNALETLKQALTELQAIKEAKPSEALENIIQAFEHTLEVSNKARLIFNEKPVSVDWNELSEIKILKQALLKAQEQEKVLEVVFGKRVDLPYLRCCFEDNQTVERYNEYINEKTITFDHEKELTQEEFDLIKKYAEVLK